MSPRQGNTWLRRSAALLGAVALFGACAPVASADESALPTTQARAYNADWVPYLDPPAKPAAVCLVDSGVNITPDTPADNPDGPIVKRLSLDGGPGTAANSTWEGLHGTRMAFVGAAPINGWGAVGFWPGARIISIRAMPSHETTFLFDAYARAIDFCNKQPEFVASVNLSLDCACTPTVEEQARLANQVTRAHANGENVVAAAGNRSGAVGTPAREAGVLGVAAADTDAVLCSFSNRGIGVDLVAPGCGTDLANPSSGALWSTYASGTSGAAMTVSVVLALLRSYRPDLTWSEAEQAITGSSRATASGPVLDVEGAFRSAQLGPLVDRAKARVPIVSAAIDTPDQPVPSSGTQFDQLAEAPRAIGDGMVPSPLSAPRLRSVRRVGRRLTVVVANRPNGARLALTLQQRRGEFHYASILQTSRNGNVASVTLPQTTLRRIRIQVRFISTESRHVHSPSVYRRLAR